MSKCKQPGRLRLGGTDGRGGQVREGPTDGLHLSHLRAWRQPTQPVVEFAPALDQPSALGMTKAMNAFSGPAELPRNETDDPEIGLVRKFEIASGVWGRYEVRKGQAQELFVDAERNGLYDPGETFEDVDGNGVWSPAQGVLDVSEERGLRGAGWAWRIESIGQVYRRNDDGLPLGHAKNPLLASYRVASEIRRLSLAFPADAAICARTGGLVQVKSSARIRAPQTGVATGTAAVAVLVSRPAEIIAPVKAVNIPAYKDELYDVFGVEWDRLQTMADVRVTKADQLPKKLPDYTLVTIDGDVTFTKEQPLEGLAIVAVRGNVTIEPGSNSYFRGVLYVDGKLTVEPPFYLRGSIVTTGWVKLLGRTGDLIEVEHDPDLVNDLMRRVGQYRATKVIHPMSRRLADGRPLEGMNGIVREIEAVEDIGTDPWDGEDPFGGDDGGDDDDKNDKKDEKKDKKKKGKK